MVQCHTLIFLLATAIFGICEARGGRRNSNTNTNVNLNTGGGLSGPASREDDSKDGVWSDERVPPAYIDERFILEDSPYREYAMNILDQLKQLKHDSSSSSNKGEICEDDDGFPPHWIPKPASRRSSRARINSRRSWEGPPPIEPEDRDDYNWGTVVPPYPIKGRPLLWETYLDEVERQERETSGRQRRPFPEDEDLFELPRRKGPYGTSSNMNSNANYNVMSRRHNVNANVNTNVNAHTKREHERVDPWSQHSNQDDIPDDFVPFKFMRRPQHGNDAWQPIGGDTKYSHEYDPYAELEPYMDDGYGSRYGNGNIMTNARRSKTRPRRSLEHQTKNVSDTPKLDKNTPGKVTPFA